MCVIYIPVIYIFLFFVQQKMHKAVFLKYVFSNYLAHVQTDRDIQTDICAIILLFKVVIHSSCMFFIFLTL